VLANEGLALAVGDDAGTETAWRAAGVLAVEYQAHLAWPTNISRCYGASGDGIASVGRLLTERWLHGVVPSLHIDYKKSRIKQ